MDFLNLYEKYVPAVRRFALFLCGDRTMADDITSETFVRAWLARERIRDLTARSYLFAIAQNAYRDVHRRTSRRMTLSREGMHASISPHTLLEHQEEVTAVLKAMRDLKGVDRAILLMKALNDMTFEEIAAALEITATAARVKAHRARIKLMRVRNPAREKSNVSGEQLQTLHAVR